MITVLLPSLSLQDPDRVFGSQGTREISNVKIVIDESRHDQTIDGFGSTQRVWSDAHLAIPNLTGPSPIIPRAIQETILRQLYTELGLTRVRTAGIRFSTEPAPVSHPGGPRDVDSPIAYVKQSMVYGLRTVISENNPTDVMTAADFKKHAENTLALLLYLRAKGVEPSYQTLMNEPTETRAWADGAWHRRVIRALGPRMRAAGLKTMLMVPDELNACRAYRTAKMILEDPEARQYVGALAYHLYDGTAACLAAMAGLSRAYKVPVWMTEYSREPGFNGSLEWAKQIHDLMANYRVSAVDYMAGFFGDYDMRRSNVEELIQITFGPNATYVGHRRTSKYYVTGQFSRFLRPGDVRIGAETDSPEVRVTAYRGANKLVIVLINDSHDERRIMVTSKSGQLPHSFVGVRTSRSEQWNPLGPIKRGRSVFIVNLPPKSVTTLWGTTRPP